MNFELTSEQKQYKDEIYGFCRKHLNDESALDCFSKELWKKISEFGILGLTVKEKYGGLEESYLTAAIAMEALGYGCINNGLIFVATNHIWVALNVISLYGTDEQKEKHLPLMLSGERIGAFALTEADAGSDAMALNAYAEAKEGGYGLNGSKMFISNGSIADIFIVIALTKQTPKEYTAFIVEKNYKGIRVGKPIPKMGLDACPISEVTFEQCFVPSENVLGKIGVGNMIMSDVITWERCYEFAPHVGAMQRVMEHCLAYVNERKQSGRYIKEFQAVSHKIANMQVAIELSRNMLYKVAWLKDQGKKAYQEAAILKLYVSENYIKICQDAMQIFGAYGYSKEYGIERELRDAMACSIYSGTSEIMRNTIFQLLSI
ncbi:MAG: acyl-CoA/acyl-ACP dehydrogenase [Eubacteriales bacterium]|nr:acyl-CoA/acyl-ACP dehydrogenase [Eubacteriales bacterium]